jgi:DNA replication protein DnaC
MTDSVVSLAALQKRLTELKLAGMKKTLEIRLQQAGGDSVSYPEFLSLLLEDEVLNRQDNRRNDLYKQAHLPFEKGIEDFDFAFQPTIKKREILELATGNFLTTKTNILFIGQPGTGKTHLSVSLGLRALSLGKTVLFTPLWEMLDTLTQSRADFSFAKKIQIYLKPDLLIIDELGYKSLSPQAVQDLFEVVARRYEKKSTIITSNRNISEWDKIFLDKTLTTALLDRLLHHCSVFEIKGESYRRMEQKQKKLS